MNKQYVMVDSSGKKARISEDEFNLLNSKKKSLPRKTRMALNAAKAVVKIAKSGAAKVGDKEAEARLTTCKECAIYYMPELERCSHPDCGCFLRKKTAFKAMKCPDGRW